MNNKAVMGALQTLQDNLGDISLSEVISKLSEKPKPEAKYFELGEQYFIIEADGDITRFWHKGSVWDSNVNYMCSGYRTMEDAKKARARQLAIIKINRLIEHANSKYQAGKMKGDTCHCIYYHIHAMEFYIGSAWRNTLDTRVLFYCNDESELKKIINENERDLKIIFEID